MKTLRESGLLLWLLFDRSDSKSVTSMELLFGPGQYLVAVRRVEAGPERRCARLETMNLQLLLLGDADLG